MIGYKLTEEEREAMRSFLSSFKFERAFYLPIEEDDLAVFIDNLPHIVSREAVKMVYNLPIDPISQVCIDGDSPLRFNSLLRRLKSRAKIKSMKNARKNIRKDCKEVIVIKYGLVFRRPFPREYRIKNRLISLLPETYPTGEMLLRTYIDRIYFSSGKEDTEAQLEEI